MSIRFLNAISLCCLTSVIAMADDVKRPNILFIIVDDQSPFDLQIYNPHSSLETPSLDRLAAEAAQQWTGSFNPRTMDVAAFVQVYRNAL